MINVLSTSYSSVIKTKTEDSRSGKLIKLKKNYVNMFKLSQILFPNLSPRIRKLLGIF